MSLGGLGSIKRLEDDGREGRRAMKREMGVDGEGEEAVSDHGLELLARVV